MLRPHFRKNERSWTQKRTRIIFKVSEEFRALRALWHARQPRQRPASSSPATSTNCKQACATEPIAAAFLRHAARRTGPSAPRRLKRLRDACDDRHATACGTCSYSTCALAGACHTRTAAACDDQHHSRAAALPVPWQSERTRSCVPFGAMPPKVVTCFELLDGRPGENFKLCSARARPQ